MLLNLIKIHMPSQLFGIHLLFVTVSREQLNTQKINTTPWHLHNIIIYQFARHLPQTSQATI